MRLGRALAAALLALAIADAPAVHAEQKRAPIAKLRVEFEVRNTNTSDFPCDSDGETYTVRGHLVGPARVLAKRRAGTVTVYVHGFESTASMWRFRAVRRYNFARRMARKGHVSLAISQLGYGASDKPPGFDTCFGSAADVLHQVVAKLRDGDYATKRGRPVSFSRVLTAGSDIGGAVVEIEAYSYGDVDGLMLIGYAAQAATDYAFTQGTGAGLRCSRGGEPVERGGPDGYTFFGNSEEDVRRGIYRRTEPEVTEAAIARRPRSPCGEIMFIPAAFAANPPRLGEIDGPVLIVVMRDDPAFDPERAALHERYFTASSDVTTVMLDDAGHFPMLERAARRRFASTLDEWLSERRREPRGGDSAGEPDPGHPDSTVEAVDDAVETVGDTTGKIDDAAGTIDDAAGTIGDAVSDIEAEAERATDAVEESLDRIEDAAEKIAATVSELP